MASRRGFLQGAACLSAAAAFARAGQVFAQGPMSIAGNEVLRMRRIPSTGEALPVIGAGTSGSYETEIGSEKYAQLKEAVTLFFTAGARLFDTSPNYNGADAVLGKLLFEGGWRERCFLATKIAADSRADAERQWAGSQRALQTDRVELLQVHNLRAWNIQLPYARELKEAGKTRYIGVTHFRPEGLAEMERIMRSEPLDFIQINYSVNAPQAAERILPLAADRGIAVIINRAFDDGRLFSAVRDRPLPAWAGEEADITSWAQMFLKFAISHPAVTCVIPATSRPDRQVDNLRAGRGRLLSEARQRELVAMFG
jgi:diketogulonate reductase-like aldo/keto reductase